jgi:hypothetical protein
MALFFNLKEMGQDSSVCPISLIYVSGTASKESFFTSLGDRLIVFLIKLGILSFTNLELPGTEFLCFNSSINFPAIPFDRKTAICQRPESSEQPKLFCIKLVGCLEPSPRDS